LKTSIFLTLLSLASAREKRRASTRSSGFFWSRVACLENAGYKPETYPGLIGVYAGCAMSSYMDRLQSNPAFMAMLGYLQVYIGNEKDYLQPAILQAQSPGPSFNVQSACSTSLLAVAVAADALVIINAIWRWRAASAFESRPRLDTITSPAESIRLTVTAAYSTSGPRASCSATERAWSS
jgi:hypothetical protein